MTEVDSDRELFDEINKFSPSEIICNNAFYMSGVDMDELKNRYQVVISALDSRFFGEESCRRILMEHFKVGAWWDWGWRTMPQASLPPAP